MSAMLLLGGLVLILYYHEVREAMEEFAQSKMLYYLFGFLALIFGLWVVLGHNYFASGNLLQILVSFLGWVLVAKGVLLTLLPHSWVGAVVRLTGDRIWYTIFGIIALGFGGFLGYLAFVEPFFSA